MGKERKTMTTSARQNDDDLPFTQIRQMNQPTVADQVFDEMHKSILSLKLPPRTKISESEVSKKMGVSRQPVREAFKRLAKLGFLIVRPQSSTTVSLISEEAVLRARYVRAALEIQTCRTAAQDIDSAGLAALKNLIEQQRAAIEENDRHKFHTLDDKFHREICVRSGVDYVWDLIQESKGHMDRIRMLSLSTSTQRFALDEHIQLYDAIAAGNADAAETIIAKHLGRIFVLIEQIKTENHTWFTDASV
jgi:DNA-binding GntR family transcriptional regulator